MSYQWRESVCGYWDGVRGRGGMSFGRVSHVIRRRSLLDNMGYPI